MQIAMDYRKEIADLKNQIAAISAETDTRNIDQYQREIKNELTLKRNQVSQLRKDLDSANRKNFELNKQLENTKSALKETDFSLKLALQKSSKLEDKMKEMEESYMKMKMKEEMRTTEINILNENLQKVAHDKHQLTTEVNELNDKLKFYCAFQNELDDRQMKINETIIKIKEDTQKLEKEHSNMIGLDKQLKCSEEFRNLCQSLAEENKKLREENAALENSVNEHSALTEKLTEFIKNHKHVNMYEQNFITKIKFLQWESRCKDLQEQNTFNVSTIQKLSNALKKEKETNGKLIKQTEKYEARIAKLVKELSVTQTGSPIIFKSESNDIVEIE